MRTLKCIYISVFATLLSAHEQATHQNLTVAALNYIQDNDSARFGLLQQYGSIYTILATGAWHEDDFFSGYPFYLGRFYFHFLPSLNDLAQFANCTSIQWGIQGLSCNAATTFPLVGFANVPNGHTWQDALDAVDATTGAPTAVGWTNLGYVIHLLEDLTSPPHVHNSAHVCPLYLEGPFCDPFESKNQLAPVNQPMSDYVGVSNLASPQDLFQRLQSYTHASYFSARTIFNGDGGPSPSFEDPDYTSPVAYFYGNCLQASIDFGTCGANGRRIAYKGADYYSYLENNGTADRRLAEINSVIAQEQFRELGPAAVNAVVALIQFYAPALTVQIQGNGTVTSSPGTGINCSSGTCSALFVQGTQVTLTASPIAGSSVAWGGACASGGTSTTVQLKLTSDTDCTATFAPLNGTITGAITSASCANDLLSIAGTATGPPGTAIFAGGIWVAAQDSDLNGLETGVSLTCTVPWSTSSFGYCQAPSSGTTSTTFSGANLKGPGTIQAVLFLDTITVSGTITSITKILGGVVTCPVL